MNRLYVCDLAVRRDAAAEWPVRRLVDNFEAQYTYLINVGQTFYFRYAAVPAQGMRTDRAPVAVTARTCMPRGDALCG